MKHKKRHALTLVEIMLVIVLIGVVGGALAFNLKGALDHGRGFKTKEIKKKIDAIVNIAAAEKDDSDILSTWSQIVSESPLVKIKTDAQKGIVDGWGNPFSLEYDADLEQFVATSPRIDAHGEIIPNS